MDIASAARAARARPAINRPPLSVSWFMVCSWVLGWWMTLDGLYDRLFGDYIRLYGQLGPWADLARAAGLDPNQLAFAFVAFGLGLIGASCGMFLRRPWGYVASLVLSAVCLLYLGLGTALAVLCVAALLLPPTRAYLVP